jgi:hypothetical protein
VKILAHNLDQPTAIDGKAHKKILKSLLSPIIGTLNRQLVLIALETYYTWNTFKVTIDHNERVQFVDVNHPPATYGHLIRKMEVHARGCNFVWDTLEEILVLAWTGWSRVLTPARPLDQQLIAKWATTNRHPNLDPDKTTWQNSFPNLRTLHITLSSWFDYKESFGSCPRCDLCAHRVQDIAGILKETSIELRAIKATATIERVPYDYESPDEDAEPEDRIKGPPVVCKCTKRLSDRVAVMATKPKKLWWIL